MIISRGERLNRILEILDLIVYCYKQVSLCVMIYLVVARKTENCVLLNFFTTTGIFDKSKNMVINWKWKYFN